MEQILVRRRGAVGSVAFDRPEALNAFTPAMLNAFVAALREFEADRQIAVVLLSGEGRAFSAGVDLKALQAAAPVAGRIASNFDDLAQSAASAVRGATVPVIAKIHGYCFTGALELALNCDFILATADAKFADTHVKWGLRPTWGMSQNLARAVGVRRARELSFSARTFTGEEAVLWGLANAAYADKETLDRAADALADLIAEGSCGAVRAYKKLYRLHEEYRPLEEALCEEARREFPEIVDTAERLTAFGAR